MVLNNIHCFTDLKKTHILPVRKQVLFKCCEEANGILTCFLYSIKVLCSMDNSVSLVAYLLVRQVTPMI